MKKDILIFGASKAGEKAFEKYKNKYNVRGFIDNDKNKWGKTLKGINIYSLVEVDGKYGKNIKIIIASMHYIEIINQLRQNDFKNISSFYQRYLSNSESYSPLEFLYILGYPIILLFCMPIRLFQTMMSCKVLLNGDWGNYSQFSSRIGLGYLWYRTGALNIYRYGRNGLTQLFGIKDYPLSNFFYYSLPSLYAFWIMGPLCLLIGMFGWWIANFIWVNNNNNILWVILVQGLALLSTTFYANTFYRQNYNALGWIFFPLGIYGLINNNLVLASIAWFFASFGSITVIFIGSIFSFIFVFLNLDFAPIFALLPAFLKFVLHLVPLFTQNIKSRITYNFKAIGFTDFKAKYIRKYSKEFFTAENVFFLIICLQFLVVLFITSNYFSILFLVGIIVFFINSSLVRFADVQSMYMMIFSLATAIVIHTHDIKLAFSYWILISPPSTFFHFYTKKLYSPPPKLKPFEIKPFIKGFEQFFINVRQDEKVLMAFDNPKGLYERIFDGYRELIELPLYVANIKGVSFLPNWFAVFENNYQGAPEFWGRDVELVKKNLEYWEAEYVIIYQKPDEIINKTWEENGFKLLSVFKWNDYKEHLDETLLGLTENLTWFLLHYPLNHKNK